MEFQKLNQLQDVRNQVKTHPIRNYNRRSLGQIRYITRHHSAVNSGDAFSYARYHVDELNWPGCGYHFVIVPDGTIQWCNDLETVSWHVGGKNTNNVGVCLVGNGSFTQDQERSFEELITALREDIVVPVRRVRGHNEFNGHYSNSCPGINMNTVRPRLDGEVPKREGGNDVNLPSRTLRRGDNGQEVTLLQEALLEVGEELPRFGADGDFGGETEDAVRSFQAASGISVDGVAGPETYQRLQEVLTKDSDTLYRVQLGAFSNRENAERLAEELKEKGYDIYIVED